MYDFDTLKFLFFSVIASRNVHIKTYVLRT